MLRLFGRLGAVPAGPVVSAGFRNIFALRIGGTNTGSGPEPDSNDENWLAVFIRRASVPP